MLLARLGSVLAVKEVSPLGGAECEETVEQA
jgi:hypothetical protein